MMQLMLIALLFCGFQVAKAEILVPTKLEDRSLRESFRKRVFPEGSPDRACKIISKDLRGAVAEDAGLTESIESLIKAIKTSDGKMLVSLFHPQLKVRLSQAKATLTSIQLISGDKVDATLFRAYGLNNLDGETQAINCPDDGLMLHPLYGHPFQAGVWIQALGRDEVTRVYAIMVPTKEKWLIGAWHVQQWTHAGKDFTVWRTEAEDLVAKKQDIAAWIYFDLTAKLLAGGKFVVFPVAKDIETERAKLLSGKSLKETLAEKFLPEKLVYASSLFSRKGASFLLRFGIPEEWSANAIREHCRAKFKQLSKESWMSALAGVRCDYVLPRESIEKEGAQGGIFVDRENLADK
jgi:hypothetical protein